SLLRKMNSKWGNIFARKVAGISDVKDCTSGYRAISAKLLKKIDLKKLRVKGYAFQISLLAEAINKDAKVEEVPINFIDRVHGQSKISYKDITEFVLYCFQLRFSGLKDFSILFLNFFISFLLGILSFYVIVKGLLTVINILLFFFMILSLLLFAQGLMNVYWMLYIWEDPRRMRFSKSPRKYNKSHYSFTALVPARHEEQVIADTIKAIANITYPESKKEVIIIARTDDIKTILEAQTAIKKIGKSNIRLVTFNDYPINKPHALNIGLSVAKNQVIVIFDAEDEPNRNIYQIANTTLIQRHADVLQSGVQLIDYRSSWFSALNVLEYFFWFKSILPLFANNGFIPLGGNTVFFKKSWLARVKGWDELCLTEDAEIGLRLSQKGAIIKVIYDERHTTREETPHSIASFIQQRTRWKQGFLQILFKGEWLKLPTAKQRILAGYVFMFPLIELAIALFIPFSLVMMFQSKLPIFLAMLSILPFYIVILQLAIAVMGLYEFVKRYHFKAPLYLPLLVLITFLPYVGLLIISVVRAIARLVFSQNSWEKTLHNNQHRKPAKPQGTYAVQ
ncbi:MAG: glycosyltransferase, partial [Candidatus Levyibacteriota bacterium]